MLCRKIVGWSYLVKKINHNFNNLFEKYIFLNFIFLEKEELVSINYLICKLNYKIIQKFLSLNRIFEDLFKIKLSFYSTYGSQIKIYIFEFLYFMKKFQFICDEYFIFLLIISFLKCFNLIIKNFHVYHSLKK